MAAPRHTNCLLSPLQVGLVEAACTEYLLSLMLPLQQLQQLILLWDLLDNLAALKQTLQHLLAKPWTAGVVTVMSAVFKHLVYADDSRLKIAAEALHIGSCGSMCELR